MKHNPSYELTYISGIPYLLPFGQANADFQHGLMLNETGAFIWNNIEKVENIDELVSLAMSHYHCTESDFPVMDGTIHCFVDSLCAKNVLIRTSTPSYPVPSTKLQIAGLFCILYGPEKFLAKELFAFESNEEISACLSKYASRFVFASSISVFNAVSLPFSGVPI